MRRKKSNRKEEFGDLIIGTFISNERGFGFVELDGDEKDIFIPAEYVKSAMNGDTVSVRLIKHAEEGRRAEGKIIDVLKRNVKMIVGTYKKSKNFGFVMPDDRKFLEDVYIPKNLRNKAKSNDRVVVQLTKYPDGKKKAEGRVIEILGKTDDTNVTCFLS